VIRVELFSILGGGGREIKGNYLKKKYSKAIFKVD
jgi:hypothetical protein